MSRARGRVLVIGVGGIGCPAALALAGAGVGTLGLCDDDDVETTNLHRQILFGEADVGAPKIDAAARALEARFPGLAVRRHSTRLLPDNAVDLVGQYDVVVEGADNYPTKFLAADACARARVPVVHASAVRWVATALAVGAEGRPCYRCLFEEPPAEGGDSCAVAGVMGPVVGFIAAVQVDLALAILDRGSHSAPPAAAGAWSLPAQGQLVTFDGRTEAFRRRTIPPRPDCPLCGQARRVARVESQSPLSARMRGLYE